jgi:acetoin utilization deacetylase AcuC-like enzyme
MDPRIGYLSLFSFIFLLNSTLCGPAAYADEDGYRTGYAYDTRFPTYYQNNSETPDRVIWINKRLTEKGLVQKMRRIEPLSDPMEWIKKVHTPEHIRSIQAIPIDTSHGATAKIGDIAELAAGYALGAVRDVCLGRVDNAFAAIRPPGHHVENGGYPNGFCVYSNAVIAAKYAQEVYHMRRILIVDWDYHFGNSTQTFLCNDTNVFFLEFGYSDAEMADCNQQTTHMVTRAVGTGTNEEFLRVFNDYLEPRMRTFKPDLIIISCGFDLKKNDGLGSYQVTARGISQLTIALMDIAQRQAGHKRIVSLLEGGYYDAGSSPTTYFGLSQCAENHVRALMTGTVQMETEFFQPIVPVKEMHARIAAAPQLSAKLFDLRGREITSGSRVMNASGFADNPSGIFISTNRDGSSRMVLHP